MYKPLGQYAEGEHLQKLCLELVDTARKNTTAKLPPMDVTHLLCVLYTNTSGMSWHRDSDENDGDNDHPIVSISLGNSCIFGYKPLLKSEQEILLESGDVLIWGGPERMLMHCVHSVTSNSSPEFLPEHIKNRRVNFTFRSAPNILGKEAQFKSDSYWVDV